MSSPEDEQGPPTKVPRTRIARACENCRARRKKCQPPYPCQACRDAGLPDCLVRDKPRPLRRRRSQQATSAPIEGSSYPHRTRFLTMLEEELERIYTSQTGEVMSVAIEEAPTHPDCNLLTPLPDLPSSLPPSAAEAMQKFCDFILPFCSYLTAPRVLALFQRYVSEPHTFSPDQTALMLACLALGFIRLQGFDAEGHARIVPENERIDVPYFRHAVNILDKWGSASFTSLHALSALWYYSTLACTTETSREMVSWMISQAKELGIHQESTNNTYSPADRADLMFVQVLYAHYWTTALTGRPPIIRPGEFETMSFRSRPVSEGEIQIIVPRRSLTELLVLNTQLMMNLHDSRNARLSLDWLLRIEERWDTWCATWVSQGRTTGNIYTDPFLGVLWDWGRLTLRAVTLNDSRLSMASLAVLSRSAVKILSCYYSLYSRLPYNLPWQNLRHIVTTAHIVIIAFWRFELSKNEAETALGHADWILSLMEPRWRTQASEARRKITVIATALGIEIKPPPTPSTTNVAPTAIVSGIDPTLDGPVDHRALGILYEALDAAVNTQQPANGGWTIDSLFLAPEYPA